MNWGEGEKCRGGAADEQDDYEQCSCAESVPRVSSFWPSNRLTEQQQQEQQQSTRQSTSLSREEEKSSKRAGKRAAKTN